MRTLNIFLIIAALASGSLFENEQELTRQSVLLTPSEEEPIVFNRSHETVHYLVMNCFYRDSYILLLDNPCNYGENALEAGLRISIPYS